jgi:hypothetical protein
MNTHSWHRVIDDVARGMTAADPVAEFRARVMEQVRTTPQYGRLSAFVWAWRGAAVAAAVVVAAIAVNLTQPFRSDEPGPSLARISSLSAPIAAPADPVASVDASAPAAAVRRAPAPQPSAALVEWRARNIPALADLAALELQHIQPAGLSISQLTVRPLDIAPIVVPSIPQIDDGR